MTKITAKYLRRLTEAQWADIAHKELLLAKRPGFDMLDQLRRANLARLHEYAARRATK